MTFPFPFPSADFDDAVAAICHGTASEEQLQGLHGALRENPAARDEYLVRVELHSRLASDPDLFALAHRETPERPRTDDQMSFPASLPPPRAVPSDWARRNWAVALTAGLVVLLAGGGWLRHRLSSDRPGATSRAVAMLNRTVNARWNPNDPPPRLGAPLEPGRLRLEAGLAQIVFYNGARVAIEGPADLRVISSSEAACVAGRLTAEVPPQARGFRVTAPRLDVTDLGTSFGLSVSDRQTELHVFEGRVDFRADREATNRSLAAGNGAIAQGNGAPLRVAANRDGFTSLFELQAKSVAADALRYDQWRRANERLGRDPSLWVHFDFEHGGPSDWRLSNTGALRTAVPDATIVGCQWQEGRWATKPALEFQGISDRVRLSVPGAADALTLAAWVRVQGLDRQINSLFMSDGFAPGTVHWVIRDDGVLGLTVIGPKGAHQILASPPVLTVDQLGLWTHLAVVLDGRSGQAVHYVNGQPISQHPVRISPPFRIGTAELGNWNSVGFPGNDPFLIRNFSGAMDEFQLFGRALGEAEIRALYSDGRPQSELPTHTEH